MNEGEFLLEEQPSKKRYNLQASYVVVHLRCDERGEMAEWSNAPVLKTGDSERSRGFESLSLRQFIRECLEAFVFYLS